jgi:hypothetical protein
MEFSLVSKSGFLSFKYLLNYETPPSEMKHVGRVISGSMYG